MADAAKTPAKTDDKPVEKPQAENLDALEVCLSARPLPAPPITSAACRVRPPRPSPPPVCAPQEDDEFEEFEEQEWTVEDRDAEDTTMWQDGWEDDEDDDQFTQHLRAELAKTDGAMQQ